MLKTTWVKPAALNSAKSSSMSLRFVSSPVAGSRTVCSDRSIPFSLATMQSRLEGQSEVFKKEKKVTRSGHYCARQMLCSQTPSDWRWDEKLPQPSVHEEGCPRGGSWSKCWSHRPGVPSSWQRSLPSTFHLDRKLPFAILSDFWNACQHISMATWTLVGDGYVDWMVCFLFFFVLFEI